MVGMDGLYKKGCANRACGSRAIVDKSDPYCPECEFTKYPRRFVACLFCRKPLRKGLDGSASSSCFECFRNIESLLVNQLFVKINDDVAMPSFHDEQHKQALKEGIKKFLSWARTGVHRSFIKDFHSYQVHAKFFKEATSPLAKPCIYLGAKREANGTLVHIWKRDLEIKPEDKKRVLDNDEAHDHIANIFLKYNICGPQTGTLIEQEVNSATTSYSEVPQAKAASRRNR